jgi:hypothetical protein
MESPMFMHGFEVAMLQAVSMLGPVHGGFILAREDFSSQDFRSADVNFGSVRDLPRRIFRLDVRAVTPKNSSFEKAALACSEKKRRECNFSLDINFAQNYTFV